VNTEQLARVFHAFVSRMSSTELSRAVEIQRDVEHAAMHHGNRAQLEIQTIAEKISGKLVQHLEKHDQELVRKVILENVPLVELLDMIRTVKGIADDSRKDYAGSKEWTVTPTRCCMTITVPVYLLNRIDELAEWAKDLK
jgi:hypothetical protein